MEQEEKKQNLKLQIIRYSAHRSSQLVSIKYIGDSYI